jgi:hypothetical protein
MKKIKILGYIIAIAMIVLLSSGVAGYNDEGKNEFIEPEQNLPDIIVSIDKESVEFHVKMINDDPESACGSICAKALVIPVEIVNNGNQNLSIIPVVFFVDGEVVENVGVHDMKEGVKRSINVGYNGCSSVNVPVFSIPSNSKIELEFIWKCSPGHHKIEIKAYNLNKLLEISFDKPPNGVIQGVKLEISDQIKDSEASITVDIKGKHEWVNVLLVCIVLIVILFVLIKIIKTKIKTKKR